MTATEHAVEVETPPLAVQPAEVGPKKIRKRSSNGRKWCTKKLMVPAPRHGKWPF
jgi:hypothetical protein